MEKKEMLEKLDKILSKYLKIASSKLNDEISYDLESEWDSVTHLKMISEIEKSFNIRFDIDEIISLESVGKIREAVLKKIKGSG